MGEFSRLGKPKETMVKQFVVIMNSIYFTIIISLLKAFKLILLKAVAALTKSNC